MVLREKKPENHCIIKCLSFFPFTFAHFSKKVYCTGVKLIAVFFVFIVALVDRPGKPILEAAYLNIPPLTSNQIY